MRILSKLLIILSVFLSFLYGEPVNVSGIITQNTTWNTDTVKVIDHVEVSDSVRLTITEGVVVVFENLTGMKIYGAVSFLGSANSKVLFTVKDTTNFSSNSDSGSWHGITIFGKDSLNPDINDSSFFDHCFIEYAKRENVESPFISFFVPNIINEKQHEIAFCAPKDMGGEWGVIFFDLLGNKLFQSTFLLNQNQKYSINIDEVYGRKLTPASYVAIIVNKNHSGEVSKFKEYFGVKG